MAIAASLFFNCIGFVIRHPGLLLVLIGVIGEVVCDWKEMDGRLARAKRLSAVLLVVGLTIEFWEAAKSDEEIARLAVQAADSNLAAQLAAKLAGQANERAANTESNNWTLQAKVLEIEAKSRWRTISAEQEEAFKELTKNCLKLPIRVRMGSGSSAEVQSFSSRIRAVLDKAGFVETNTAQSIAEWPPEMQMLWNGTGPELPPIIFVSNPKFPGKIIDLRNAQTKLKSYASYATNSFVKTEFEFTGDDSTPEAFVRDENGSPVLHIKVTDPAVVQVPAFGTIQNAFSAIGFRTGTITSTNIPVGVFEVFVNPK